MSWICIANRRLDTVQANEIDAAPILPKSDSKQRLNNAVEANLLYPIATSTYRPSSTPWPSKTPTPTPPFVYRPSDTPVGGVEPTATHTPDKTNNPKQTLTAFFATRTALSFTATFTQQPTETRSMESSSPELIGTEQEGTSSPEEEPTITPTRIFLPVDTEKTDRYQEKVHPSSWLFWVGVVLLIGVAIWLTTRKKLLI